MKAIIKVYNRNLYHGCAAFSKYEMTISRDENKIIIESPNNESILKLIDRGEFEVFIQPEEDEIGCCDDCGICLTPIC